MIDGDRFIEMHTRGPQKKNVGVSEIFLANGIHT